MEPDFFSTTNVQTVSVKQVLVVLRIDLGNLKLKEI